MKTTIQKKLTVLLSVLLIGFAVFLLSDCKGHVEIHDIVDSTQNCSPPYVVYFFPEAEHRSKDLEFTWNFGDSTESHDEEPVHIYKEHGIYQVSLTIRQNKAIETKSIYLYLTPDSTAPYSDWDYASKADSLWAPAYVEFQNYSKHATGYLWQFGDGETSTDKNPIHIFDSQGTYSTILNAVCNTDTSKYTRQMVIKPAPHKIDIFDVTLWMPNSYIASNVEIVVFYGGYEEVSVGANNISGFPSTFEVGETLFHFNGNYNTDELMFKIYSSYGDGTSEETFEVKARDLQLDYYPTVLSFDDLEGIKLIANIGYRQ